jgi:hypothetical protein
MIETLLVNTFVVFGITLLVTKAKILSCPREFVANRFKQASSTGRPGFVHRFWHAWWTCPMCLGAWVSIPVCLLWPSVFVTGVWLVLCLLRDICVCFGANWLLHCLENSTFMSGKKSERDLSIDRLESTS